MIPTVIEINLSLPIPPSVNSAYVNVVNKWTGNSKGRSLSREAKLWKQGAAMYLLQYKTNHSEAISRISKFKEVRYHVDYIFNFSTKTRRDIANFEKCLSDFLVENHYYRDDSLIDRMGLIRGEICKDGLVDITIQAHCQ